MRLQTRQLHNFIYLYWHVLMLVVTARLYSQPSFSQFLCKHIANLMTKKRHRAEFARLALAFNMYNDKKLCADLWFASNILKINCLFVSKGCRLLKNSNIAKHEEMKKMKCVKRYVLTIEKNFTVQYLSS